MQTKFITYKLNALEMEGYIAIGDSSAATQPLVIVLPDWTGNREFAQEKAGYFAKQGFVAFVADLYGKGKRGSDTDKAINQKLFTELMQQRSEIVPRIQAAINCAEENAKIDTKKIMLIGFCLGGLCVLDFARSGANIAGVVSVHGLLNAPNEQSKAQIKAKVLVMHGYEDKSVPPDHVLSFANEMNAAKADWQIHMFGNTMHAFTNPKANDPAAGLVYNPTANFRTWAIVRTFVDEIFLLN